MVRWVLFAVAILLSASSKFLARIIFFIVSAFEKRVILARALKKHMEHPLSLGMQAGFLFLGVVVFIPWTAPVIVVQEICAAIARFLCWCAIWYACFCFLNMLVELLPAMLRSTKLEESARTGLVEAAIIVEFVIMFVITVVLLVTIPASYNSETLTDILTLFTKINIVTGVLAVALAPIMRDLVAGLTLFVDGNIKVHDFVHIWGVAPPGLVERISLRVTVLRVWPEDFLIFIPNNKLLRFPAVVFSSKPHKVRVALPLALDTSPEKLRQALRAFADNKTFGSVDVAPGMMLVAESPPVHAMPTAAETAASMKTELLLQTVDMCRKEGLLIRT